MFKMSDLYYFILQVEVFFLPHSLYHRTSLFDWCKFQKSLTKTVQKTITVAKNTNYVSESEHI